MYEKTKGKDPPTGDLYWENKTYKLNRSIIISFLLNSFPSTTITTTFFSTSECYSKSKSPEQNHFLTHLLKLKVRWQISPLYPGACFCSAMDDRRNSADSSVCCTTNSWSDGRWNHQGAKSHRQKGVREPIVTLNFVCLFACLFNKNAQSKKKIATIKHQELFCVGRSSSWHGNIPCERI